MKRLFFPITMLLLVFFGCNSKDLNEVDVEPYTLSDSLFIESEYGDGYSYFNVSLDLPVTNNKTLRQNIPWNILSKTLNLAIPS
jgi:hypothetical protein